MSGKTDKNLQGLGSRGNTDVDEPVVNDKPTIGKRLMGLRDKFKLGPHHKMERFTIMLSATLSFLLLFTVLSFTNHRSTVATQVSMQSIFTEDFSFSLSEQQGSVEGIYGNKEKTDVMLLIKFQDSHAMSADAKNYELFISGEKKSMSYEPEVSFSLFGSTGYGIIRFQSDEPIKREILDVTIRANSELAERSDLSSAPTDGSFSEFDQAKLFINPGADDIKSIKGLKKGEDDPRKLYIALVAEEIDKEIHVEIAKLTKELGQYINRASEYNSRLISTGYIAPKAPKFFEGDYIDEEGHFRPATNVSSAYVFDYVTKDINDGYLNQLISDMSDFDEFMRTHAEQVKLADSEEREENNIRILEVTHSDGHTLLLEDINSDTSSSAQVATKDSVDSLRGVWRSYMLTKTKLQKDLMRKLIILDADVQSQPSGYTEHSGEDAVWFY